jgi:hypothetical protein
VGASDSRPAARPGVELSGVLELLDLNPLNLGIESIDCMADTNRGG